MSLNIKIDADIDGLRGLADWFGAGAEAVHNAGSATISAKGDAEHDWKGASGQSFHAVMAKASTGIDGVSGDMTASRTAVSAFADDIATVKSRLGQARDVATAAGLEVTDTEIKDPGPAPASPAPLPADGSATPERRQAFTSAQSAVSDHQAKVAAFNQASQIVTEARGKENVAMSQLARFGNEQVGKAPFTFADVSSGLAGEAIKRTTRFRALAASYGKHADRALRLAMSKGVTDPTFAKAARLHAEFATKQSKYLDGAVKSLPARALDKLPGWAKSTLTKQLGDFKFLKGGSTAAKVGKAVLGKVPVVGLGITALSTTVDIANGKNPVQSVASGVSSLATGAAVGAAIGGPVGVVVGAAVGAGVGYVVDEWGDEIAGAVGDGAEAVGGAVADSADAVADGVKSAGKFIGNLF